MLLAGAAQAETSAHKSRQAAGAKKAASPKLAAKNRAAVRGAKLAAVAERPSFGQLAGLHGASDPLDLRSSVALVIDQDTHEVLLRKNDQAVLPIASLTKLMNGLVISDANLPMSEMITITQDDVDTEKGSRSRLAVGTVLSRGDLLHLALMSSENRAAHALGRTYPGGLDAFVARMNARAQGLGMGDTLQYNNTNRLVKSPQWDIGLQKTGYISEAGQCLVMQAQVAGRKLIMVFLDSAGKLSRIADAERVRRWIETSHRSAAGHNAAAPRQG